MPTWPGWAPAPARPIDQESQMDNQNLNAQPTNKGLLAAFWLYVLVPLVWGVSNTITQAMKLFQ